MAVLKTIYHCEICGREYKKKSDARKHEAMHFGLTADQYERWGYLVRDVESMEHIMCNERLGSAIIKAHEESVKTLLQYEEAHNLRGKKPLADCIRKESEE